MNHSRRNTESPTEGFEIQPLEPRLLMAATPASVLTKPIRQTLLSGLNVSIKSSLQAKLNANDLAGFDTQLLSYMQTRPNTHFYFQLSEVPGIASYITSDIGDGGATARANDILAHTFPETSDSQTYTVSTGSTIDWTAANASKPEFLHALNRHTYWVDLSRAFRYTGSGTYVTEMTSELASWSQAYPTMAPPTTWSAADQKSWLLDMGIRSEFWTWSYYQVLGASQWTKEANTLFLYKTQQQASYLASATTYGVSDNRSLSHAKGWLFVAEAFPEFVGASTWQTNARSLLFNCLDGQFYDDGSHREQSPGYASGAISDLLDAKLLDNKNGVTWTADKSTKLTKAINSYYQFLTPDGKRPALGDTHRVSSVTMFLKADLVQGVNIWSAAKPRGSDAWLFGTAVITPYAGNPQFPSLGDRGKTYAMTDSGNYIMRSGADADARQISFRAGSKGGQHGHFDELSFELSGYGKPLIADPGAYRYDTSANRAWAISTPAHNTVSLDAANHGALEGATNPGFKVDSWDVQADHVQITAHHFGYSYLSGGPVVSRSIWYDYDGTMLVLDWAEGAENHDVKTSFLIPGTSTARNLPTGTIRSTNASGGNVKIQALLQAGQTASYKTTGIFTSNNPPPNQSDPATQFFVYQTGSFVVFATLITAYTGTTPPNITASLTSTPAIGQPVSIHLNKNGTESDIAFTPPVLTRPDAKGTTRGSYSDLAYDKQGRLHLAFFDRDDKHLKHTVRSATGKWSPVETIDNGLLCGFDPSIAIDSKGRVGIAYTNANNGDLKYAFNNGAAWLVETVDAKGSTGHYPSFAFSRKDGPVITYYDKTKGDLRMATSAVGGWNLSTIDTGTIGTKDVGRFSALSLDASRPDASKWAIAYEDTGGARYRYAIQGNILGGEQKNGYTFFTVSPSTKLGGYTSLAFDSANRPAISFYDSAISGLRFAKSSGDTFNNINFTASTVTQKGAVGYYSNLYYNSSGKPTIFYFDKTQAKAMRAVFSSNKWNAAALATGGREIHVARYGSTVAFTNLDEAIPALKVLVV